VIATPAVEAALREAAIGHRHLCPRQVLGVRMGLQAGELLGLELPQTGKRLYAFIETDGCFADGITAATACSVGHRTLRLMDEGKVACTFGDSGSGRALRIWPSPDSRTRALEYAPHAPNRWRAQLEGYQVMPASELLCVQEVELLVDLNALIGKPGVRVNCGRCGEEILNGREISSDGKILCRGCAQGTYARALSPETDL
jgi:formylmethanofuran dehydrogenase subunit E